MKKTTLIIIVSFMMFHLNAQNSSFLLGLWKIQSNDLTGQLILNRVKNDKNEAFNRNWGHFIEFYEEGTYTERASAPCGLDDNHYSYCGKWTFNASTQKIELKDIKVLNDRPNIYNNYRVLTSGTMEILANEPESLTIKITKSWEKVSKKR
jgi:hypothetical protein